MSSSLLCSRWCNHLRLSLLFSLSAFSSRRQKSSEQAGDQLWLTGGKCQMSRQVMLLEVVPGLLLGDRTTALRGDVLLQNGVEDLPCTRNKIFSNIPFSSWTLPKMSGTSQCLARWAWWSVLVQVPASACPPPSTRSTWGWGTTTRTASLGKSTRWSRALRKN